MKLTVIFLFGLLPFTACLGQTTIEVVINHGGLHCPFLGPKFALEFNKFEMVDSTIVDSQNSIGYIHLAPGGNLTDAEITDIVVNKVGYPEPEIKAINRNGSEE